MVLQGNKMKKWQWFFSFTFVFHVSFAWFLEGFQAEADSDWKNHPDFPEELVQRCKGCNALFGSCWEDFNAIKSSMSSDMNTNVPSDHPGVVLADRWSFCSTHLDCGNIFDMCVVVRTTDLFVIMLYLQDRNGAVPWVTPENTNNMIWFFKPFPIFFWSSFSLLLYHPFSTPSSSQVTTDLITSFSLILILLHQNFIFLILLTWI